MPRIKMEKLDNPDPSSQSIIVSKVAPVMRGDDDTDYVCAGCDTTLLSKIAYKALRDGVVFKCPNCGTHSVIAQTHHMH